MQRDPLTAVKSMGHQFSESFGEDNCQNGSEEDDRHLDRCLGMIPGGYQDAQRHDCALDDVEGRLVQPPPTCRLCILRARR